MKRLKFLETKRTPHYSLRKLNVGVASVLLGVTIFGINFTNHSVKAATTESVKSSNSSPNSNSQQPSTVVLPTAEQTKGINAIGAVKVPSLTDSQNDANKAIDAALNKKNSEINGATNIDQTTKDKLNQAATDAADKAKEAITKATTNNDVATEQTNTQKATSATEKVPEAATTLQSAPKTQGSAGSGASGSSATGVVSGSQASNSQAASPTGSAATDSKAASETQVTAPAASQSSESANSGNATSSPASQAGTTSANHTAIGKMPSSQTVSVDEAKSPATQARTLMMNLAVINPDTKDTLPKSTQTYTVVRQPLLTDYLTHLKDGNRDGETWVNKTLKYYPDATMDTIFGTTSKSKSGIITSPTSPSDKYFFAAYVDYNSSYHRIILLARSQDPTDNNLYSYIIHTYRQATSSETVEPNTDKVETYHGFFGLGGSDYDLLLKNYQGKSYMVILKGFKSKEGNYGLLPVFDGGLFDHTYYSDYDNQKNSYKDYYQNDKTAETKSIGFWASAIPQETSTKVRYVDQATGKDIVQPMEISGFGYQGFQVKGDAPTVKGYHLVSKPKFLGLPYEDGTIAPYKVGQTYDLALSDSVVIKQTVIDTDGTVRATPYYNGSPLTNASKVLGRESYNDHMSFSTSDGKYYTYTNRIGQVDDSYIYYYAKDSDPKGSEMRLHFIDVTGVNNSSYAPSDGPELVDKVQTIHGNIGDKYGFTYTVPTNYYEVGSRDVTGTYSGTHHDAYVYVKIDRNGAKATIENLTHLNHAQKQAAEAAIDQATDLNTMNQAISTATTLDGDMGKLSDLTADLTNTNNYKYASDKPKSTVAADYTNADVLLDKDDKTAGQNADDATVLKLIDQINTHKSSLDGDKNLSAAETTISGLTHLNDAQRSAANQAVTNASDLTGLKTAVGNAQSVDSAMSDLQTAAKAKNDAIDASNLTAEEKAALKQEVSDAQTAANQAIDKATTKDAVNTAKENGVETINKVNVPDTSATKDAAKDAIDQAAKTKDDAIDASNLTAEEKDALKKTVAGEVQTAKGNIDAATKDADVKTAQTNGEKAINAVEIPASVSKTDAKNAIADALNNKKSEINGATNIDQPTKDNLIKEATDAATKAKDAIDKAKTNNDVATEQTKGTKAIDAVKVPSLTDSQTAAKQVIDEALNNKKSEINGATNIDQTTKENLINKATDAATEQPKSIKAIDAVKVPSLTDSQKAANKAIADAINGIPVKSNSVDDQDNSATNAGDSSQTGHIQSESTGNVTNPSAQQAAGSVKDQLPQTGDETQHGAGLVGLVIAGLVGLLGSAGFRKKRD